jgi:hypothetical protein
MALRALTDLEESEVVLIERPLAHHETNVTEHVVVFSSSPGNIVNNTSTVRQKETTLLRCNCDGVLCRILNHLSDGSKQMPLVPAQNLLMSVDSCPLLLPGHHEYFRDSEQPNLPAERIQKILDVNQHGTGNQISELKNSSTLSLTVSMMIHVSNPTCLFLPVSNGRGGPVIVVTKRHVQKGEELTMTYHENEAALSKWQIEDGS